MAIGRFLGEAITEGLIFRFLANIWRSLSGAATGKLGEKVVEKMVDSQGRSLDDETYFSALLAKAQDPNNRKSILREVIKELDEEDARNKTRYVRNFRLIIAIDVKEQGSPPGLFILEEMLKECANKDEFRLAIYITGAMQDAPFGSFDEFKLWARKTAIPAAMAWIQSGSQNAKKINKELVTFLNKDAEKYKKRSLWKRLFFN
ncbi:MAG: hypothetical protein Athens071425_340 [Parcubacteria group bacterium Athens0714_25]|nr:MAG: hypothetical protein Athens071425_340 [Parcubacteria group bacterium Athens0714_25]